jgi:hypothetical protein
MTPANRIAAGLLAGLVLALSSLAGAAPTDRFTAVYKLTKSGIPLGKATFTLKPGQREGCYVYTGHGQPNALAHLLIGAIEEKSHICIVDGQPHPSRYRYHIDGEPDDSYTLKFDWSKMIVKSAREDGQDKTYPLKSGTQDSMSLQIAARLWLAAAAQDDTQPGRHKFILADDDGTESYKVKASDGGTLKVPAGRYETLKIARTGEHSHAMTFWMARNADWIPVQVNHLKHGKTDYTLTLQSLSLHKE